jgi:hypothetical protein
MSRLPQLNLISRLVFLLLTPAFFLALNFAFIWHSIYRGTVTLVVLIWTNFILLSPLVGRVGCGWVCFMGTIQDLASEHALYRIGWRKPLLWLRLVCLVAFLASAFTFFLLHVHTGRIAGSPFAHCSSAWDYGALQARMALRRLGRGSPGAAPRRAMGLPQRLRHGPALRSTRIGLASAPSGRRQALQLLWLVRRGLPGTNTDTRLCRRPRRSWSPTRSV